MSYCHAKAMAAPVRRIFAESVRRFAEASLVKGALQRAHDPHFPFDVAQLAAQQGLLGITIPEKDGGQGGTLMDAVLGRVDKPDP